MKDIYEVQTALAKVLGIDLSARPVMGFDLSVRGDKVPTLSVTYEVYNGEYLDVSTETFDLTLSKPAYDGDAMVAAARREVRSTVNDSYRWNRDNFAGFCKESTRVILKECDEWRAGRFGWYAYLYGSGVARAANFSDPVTLGDYSGEIWSAGGKVCTGGRVDSDGSYRPPILLNLHGIR